MNGGAPTPSGGGGGGGGGAMAGESPHPNPHRTPPPLLFQFPTLSPSPWFQHPQPSLPAPPPPQSSQPDYTPMHVPMHQHQQQQHQSVQFGNLNSFQRLGSAPDLNRIPVPFPATPLGFTGVPSKTLFQDPMLAFAHASHLTHLQHHSSSSSPPLQHQQQQLQHLHVAPPPPQQQQTQQQEQEKMVVSTGDQHKVARNVYPPALATQEEVVSDSEVFFKTLNKFFECMGWQLTIPRVGGKVFEIHRLYCEVTEQGGLEKVTREKKWRDIATAFVLPKTVTSPTYFLRKHYINILHHYEQVYYHRRQGPFVRPPDALPGPLQTPQQQKPAEPDQKDQKKKRGRTKFDQVQGSKVDPLASLGHTVTGAIDGKFDHGYFVTVVVGSEKLRGVIYSIPEDQDDEGEVDVEGEETLLDPCTVGGRLTPRKRRRGRPEGSSKKDPKAVRQPRNPYNFFVAEKRLNMRGARTELSKAIGTMWKELPAEAKLPYVVMAKKDRERYNMELAERGGTPTKPPADEEDDDEDEQDDASEAVDEMPSSRQPVDCSLPQPSSGNFKFVHV